MVFTIVAVEDCPSPLVGDPTWCIFVVSMQPPAIAVTEETRSAPFAELWQFFFTASFFQVTLLDSGLGAFGSTAGAAGAAGAAEAAGAAGVTGGGVLSPHAARV